ncbi:MAG: CoA transferase [Dehalococcoidia bacterium]|nr:CoA transferase [Dehalococcoidia bacterium]
MTTYGIMASTPVLPSEGAMILPMDSIRVLDLSDSLTGPFCTRVLADYGADVIKIEDPLAGDPARRMGPFYHDEPDLEKSGLFLFLNTSKRSMTLNLQLERGKEVLKDIIRKADVVIENFKPGVMASLGLSYEALSTINPRLVMTSITNFGQSGPYRDWEGTNLTLFAMGGAMAGAGDPQREPLKTAGQMASFHVGYSSALATAMALLAADIRGAGEHVDVSFFEVAMNSIDGRIQRILEYQYSDFQPIHRVAPGSSRALGSGTFECLDGFFTFNVGPAVFPPMARMVGAEYLLEDPQWATVAARFRPEAAKEFEATLVPWCMERTKAQIRDLCIHYRVLGGPINTVADLVTDASFNARSFFQTIDHPAVGPLQYPGYQFRVHTGTGEPMPPRRPAPLLGQHTQEVLRELGYKDEEIGRLRAQGVI